MALPKQIMERITGQFNKDDLARFNTLLAMPSNIIVVSHSNPDGDALGSALAVYHLLAAAGKNVKAILPNAFPDFLAWLPAANDVLIFDTQPDSCTQIIENADLIICVDFNSLSRVAAMEAPLRASSATKILVDHHLQPEASFDLCFSFVPVSSTSELLFHLFSALNLDKYFNLELAECLYVGIMTDTGSFSYSCSWVETFLVTARLMELGIQPDKIHRLVYDTYSESRMRLMGHCLSDRLVVLPEFKTAYIYLSKEDLVKFHYQVGDTEGLVNFALAIKGIVLAAFFTEYDGYIRVSLRSKGNFSVNEFARKHLDGGGHMNAAGGNSYVSLPETLRHFEELLPLYAQQITQYQD